MWTKRGAGQGKGLWTFVRRKVSTWRVYGRRKPLTGNPINFTSFDQICLRFSFCVFCSAFPFLFLHRLVQHSKMNVKRCAPRTERQKSHPPEDSADRHLTAADMWAKLLDRSENLLQAYRDTLILYAKWHNFARDFLPRLAKYTAACEWTAVDVLRDMAAQEDVLVDYGAASTLRDVTQKLERYFAGETTTLVDKKRCVELLEQLCGIITLDHPREHPSETSMENRRLLEGEFERAATKVRLWIFRLMYCLDTYTALAAEEENDKDAAENAAGDTAKEPGDVATPSEGQSFRAVATLLMMSCGRTREKPWENTQWRSRQCTCLRG